MQAVYFEKFGSPEVLKFGGMPEPECGSSQVVIEVKAASINPVDYKIVEGEGLPLPLFGKFPRIPGSDFAGVVLKAGSSVTHVKPGDEVYARPGKDRIGTLAELIAMNEAEVAVKPKNLPME